MSFVPRGAIRQTLGGENLQDSQPNDLAALRSWARSMREAEPSLFADAKLITNVPEDLPELGLLEPFVRSQP